MKNKLALLLIITNVITLGGLVYLYTLNSMASSNETATMNKISNADKPLELPSDAVKISECVPFEGEHYVQPSKVPYGPIYLTNKGQVVALELMFPPDKIPGEKMAKMSPAEFEQFLKKNNNMIAPMVNAHDFAFDLYGAKVKSLGIGWSAPHAGITEPHYDIHAFLIDDEETKNICPDAKIDTVYSQEVMQNINKYKIPFPGMPAPSASPASSNKAKK